MSVLQRCIDLTIEHVRLAMLNNLSASYIKTYTCRSVIGYFLVIRSLILLINSIEDLHSIYLPGARYNYQQAMEYKYSEEIDML